MHPEQIKVWALQAQANELYQAGMNRQAAELYHQAAELCLQSGQIGAHVHCLRWTGNSFMWSFLHEEAYPHLLQAVSYHNHPKAWPEDIYTAMTDLCLLCIRSRELAQIQEILTQTRGYLEKRRLQHWSHRIDRLETMLLLRQGNFSEAHQIASRSWLGMTAASDGPRYQNGAYLDALFRAAHGLGDREEMARAMELFRNCGEAGIATSMARQSVCLGMHFAFDGVTENNRDTIRDLAREAINIIDTGTSPFEESSDAIRLLLVSDAVDEAQQAFARRRPPNAAEAALLELDLRMARIPEFGTWQPAFFRNNLLTAHPSGVFADISTDTRNEIQLLVTQAETKAQAEDSRLGCETQSRALTLRKEWLAALNANAPCAAAA